MGFTKPTVLLTAICSFLLCHSSLAQVLSQGPLSAWQSPRHGAWQGCSFEQLSALEPSRRTQSQAGFTEYFEESGDQLRCAGLSVVRRVIEPRGLLLPQYSNSPLLIYILQGHGITGPVIPGCPETYQQQFQQSGAYEEAQPERQSEKFRDEHQKIHRFRQGDIIALPAGVAHWCYNDGDQPVVAIYVYDVSNNANQLDQRHRDFLLAGRHERGQLGYERFAEEHAGNNVFSGFSVRFISEALGVSHEVAQRLQGRNDQRGEIIRVEHGLQFLRPRWQFAEIQQEQQAQSPREFQFQPREFQRNELAEAEQEESEQPANTVQESFCSLKIRQNINDPNRADIYNPRAGRITHLNAQNFPILNLVRMSAVRGVLNRDAIVAPFWNINAHALLYGTQGRALIQIVNNRGKTVFHGELRRGQLLVVPQYFAIIKKAQQEGFSFVEFKTNANAMVDRIVGKSSLLRSLPVDVVASSYRVSREEARRLKFNRGDEIGVFSPRFEFEFGRGPFAGLQDQ